MSCNGIVKCDLEPENRDGDASTADNAATFHPSKMHAFIRPHRYQPGGSHANNHDLFRVAALDADVQKADLLLLVSDNGGDYTLDSSLNQHCLGRLWRKYGYAWAGHCAYAAGDSSSNWEIEQQWTQNSRSCWPASAVPPAPCSHPLL